ncbi:MAG: diguanylate cyclase [Rhodocyclaceae bacterium]|jgi:diguanylate cyclase (GGDEF)-like protein|nr:diguanylate cyclase [Rhodocyclaceae bacterium]
MKNQSNNAVSLLQNALSMLRDLDLALSKHLQWLKELHRTLICTEAPKPGDLTVDAYRQCCFGKWFYGLPVDLRNSEYSLQGMESPHQDMHDAARKLLLAHQQGQAISAPDYERFMEVAMDFKMALVSCQNHIISQICTVDHLTGAWNRHAMSMRLNEELERSRRSGATCCLSLMDLDHFKQVNDIHGHGAGDDVLRAVARFIKDKIRPYDSFFRFGGEEFMICLPDTGPENAAVILNRLREDLGDFAIPISEDQSLQITASFGITVLDVDEDLEGNFRRADHALLCAKAKGRNQVCYWELTPA